MEDMQGHVLAAELSPITASCLRRACLHCVLPLNLTPGQEDVIHQDEEARMHAHEAQDSREW